MATFPVKAIKESASTLLHETVHAGETERVLKKIHRHFQDLTNISGFGQSIQNLAAIPTHSGMALGLNHAAQCLLDYKRTELFLKGMVAAIRNKQKQFPGQTIRIFYAGCGPYAPFITLVAPFFQPEELQYSLLEINPTSLDSAKRLIASLDQTPYVQDYYLADAVTFRVPAANTFHILFSETLDTMLYREAYVPILWNLMPQFSTHTTIIPENVYLDLSLISYIRNSAEKPLEQQWNELKVGRIFDVQEHLKPFLNQTEMPAMIPAKLFPLASYKGFDGILIDTSVQVFEDFRLTRGESPLTVPIKYNIDKNAGIRALEFVYHLKPQVELKSQIA